MVWGSGELGTAGMPQDHPAGPVGLLWSPPCPEPCYPALQPKGRDSMTFLIKLVKRAKCHRICLKRPVIVPIFQNGVKKSPLGFLGFLFLPAFSHKELMGRFDHTWMFIVKMTKCRPVAHPPVSRERVVRYPHGHTQQAAPVCPLLICLSAVFSTRSVLTVLHLIMTETGIWDR